MSGTTDHDDQALWAAIWLTASCRFEGREKMRRSEGPISREPLPQRDKVSKVSSTISVVW